MLDDATKAIIVVQAGLVPGKINKEFSKQFFVTAKMLKEGKLSEATDEALKYIRELTNTAPVNWVKFEWITL